MKLTLNDITGFVNSAVVTVNDNSAAIEAAFENTLSRNGLAPNAMLADFDMNSFFILNLPAPTNAKHAATKKYVDDLIDIVTSGEVLTPAGASLVGFTPVGTIAATNVQTAIQELDDEAVERAQDSVASLLVNSARITLSYNDTTPSLTADLVVNSVDNTFLSDMAQTTIKGRASGAGTGDPTDLTPTQVRVVADIDSKAEVDAKIVAATPSASDTIAGLIELATQAEQETGTDVVRAVTPGRQHFHPSAAKAWAVFNGSGTAALTTDYGVASITDNGTGDYTFTLDTAFSSENFVSLVLPSAAATEMRLSVTTTTTSRIQFFNSAGAATDTAAKSSVAFFGDL